MKMITYQIVSYMGCWYYDESNFKIAIQMNKGLLMTLISPNFIPV